MNRTPVVVTMLAFGGGCTTLDSSHPEPNLSPQGRFVIFGRKDPELEVHLRLVFMTQYTDCLEQRPLMGGEVVRLHRDGLSFAAGTEEFTAEFFLDRYSPGHCQWRARNIEASVNRPPFRKLSASWQSIVWADGALGTPGLEETRYVCISTKPGSSALHCDGPIAAITELPGQLRVLFVAKNPPQGP